MYDLHCPFDIEQHKKTYINYLEVVIFPDGHIEYAVPSHQEKLIDVCINKLGISRFVLERMCPPEYYMDFQVWLCNMSGCVSVWDRYIVKSDTTPLTKEQEDTIKLLKKEGLVHLNEI